MSTKEVWTIVGAWVTVQFIWQGAVTILLGTGINILARNAQPHARYRFLCIEFTALTFLPFITLTIALLHMSQRSTNPWLHASVTGGSKSAVAHVLEWSSTRVQSHFVAVGAVWAVGALLLLMRLCLQACRLHKLAYAPASERLQELGNACSRRMNVMNVKLMTGRVIVPSVYGWRAPLLLLPHGIEGFLRQEELEAILLHELAHVGRKDYFWNIVQRSIATIYWIHPAIWLLLWQMNNERELACDATATQSTSAIHLARGLLRLAEVISGHASGALSSTAGNLRIRIAALLQEPEQATGNCRKALWCSVLCASAVGTITLGLHIGVTGLQPAVTSAEGMFISAHDDAGEFKLHIQGTRVMEAFLDDEPVPARFIAQRGTEVFIGDPMKHRALHIELAPHGIRWTSRKR